MGSLAMDGVLPREATSELARHVGECTACATYLGQAATISALLSAHARICFENEIASDVGEGADIGARRVQRYLETLARAVDPLHAEDLVQDTWEHVLGSSSNAPPMPGELVAQLVHRLSRHTEGDTSDTAQWAESLLRAQRSGTAGTHFDGPTSPITTEDLRSLSDTESLDPDADSAELFFPGFYGDEPDKRQWHTRPVAWPAISRLLGPDAEIQTDELYSVVDAALDELPQDLDSILTLVDLEGMSLESATRRLSLDPAVATQRLVRARHHLRGRVGEYLAGR
ncbi:hypothetical protein ABZ729_36755 [Streptomyces sp. NPDC006678]|uniref:hypothetical protein n=1 Tax=Streptomyces sp. NPDC006678 TaxID=3157185 RepID=UPI0033F4E1A1